MKTCNRCGDTKAFTEFRKDKTKSDGYQYMCKDCRKMYDKTNYGKYQGDILDRTKANRDANVSFVESVKDGKACCNCGEDSPCCFDFHHLDPTEKEASISQMGTYSLEKLKVELRKCVILCSNCHLKHHNGGMKLPDNLTPLIID